jgi:hypothetical protein
MLSGTAVWALIAQVDLLPVDLGPARLEASTGTGVSSGWTL